MLAIEKFAVAEMTFIDVVSGRPRGSLEDRPMDL